MRLQNVNKYYENDQSVLRVKDVKRLIGIATSSLVIYIKV